MHSLLCCLRTLKQWCCAQVDVALNSRRDRHIADRGTKGPASVGGAGGMNHQAAFNWADVVRFKETFPSDVMPLIIKGIMSVPDAVKCVDVGVDAIWVSNHGAQAKCLCVF